MKDSPPPVFSEITVLAFASASNSSDRLLRAASNSAAFDWQSCVVSSSAAASSVRASSVIFKSAVWVVNWPCVSPKERLAASRSCALNFKSSSKDCWSIWKLWLPVVSVWRASASCDSAFEIQVLQSLHDGPAVTLVHRRSRSARGVDVVRIIRIL